MRNTFGILTIILMILFISCSDSTTDQEDLATINGTVYGIDENNNVIPLSDALVSVVEYLAQTRTDAAGNYSLGIELADEEAQSISLSISRVGYSTESTSLIAQKGESIQAPDVTLTSLIEDSTGNDTTGTEPTLPSGDAAHIEISGTHDSHIYVMSAGLQETAQINFVVKDASGIPVDEEHKVLVHFSIIGGPNGGEFVSPDTMTTEAGNVYTVLNSGIKAGPVQLQATASVNGQTISTTPVRISIYGGLPDKDHFSLTADQLNIAGLRFSGLLDNITAYVGDKYSNPVAPGTVVYFSSSYGIVDGSAETDEMGRATVQFMTAAPSPPNPADSAFVRITGWTFDDLNSENSITSRATVLLTDYTAPITINPSTFSYNEINTPKEFSFTVQDNWGRPLVADSRIEVTSTDGELYGDTDVTTSDTQISGPGLTEFSFTWAPGDSLLAPQVFINITVSTPEKGNGYQSVSIEGSNVSK